MVENPGNVSRADRPGPSIHEDETMAAEAEQQLVSGIVGMNLAIIQTGDQMTGAQHAIEDLAPGIRRRVKQRDEYFCLSVQSRHGRILHKNW